MFGLPSELDLSRFEGLALTQLTFRLNLLQIFLGAEVRITIESCIGCWDENRGHVRAEDFREVAAPLLKLLERNILGASAVEKGTLRLDFEAGEYIEIYDDSDQFESYTIAIGEDEMVVV